MCAAVGSAIAQDRKYPENPIRLIVSFPPGSGADTTARFYARELEARVGKPVIVENRPGANSFLAAQAVARAAPDGYTLFVASNSPVAGNVAMFKSMPYDPVNDFAPIARLNMGAMGLVVPAASPWRDVPSLLAALRSPGRVLNYGSGSASYQITTEYFLKRVDGKANHIPYKGVAPALIDLAGGQIDFLIGDYSAIIPHLQSGKARLLATTGAKRLAGEPQVPTLIESGLVDFNFVNWTGVFAPAGTPASVIDYLGKQLHEIAATPQALQLARSTSTEVFPAGPAEFGRFQKAEIDRWSNAARQAGIEKQ